MRSTRELAGEICSLAGRLNAGTHQMLVLIAEFDRRKGWIGAETKSCAHWLNWKCGIAIGAAREKVRVAAALEQLPKISAAMSRGTLSYSKVREITRIANAANEDYLLMIGEHGTAAHVEKLVRSYRRCQEAEELSREARQQRDRRVVYRHDDDGSLILTCRLPAETGAMVLKMLDIAHERLPPEPKKDAPAGTFQPPTKFSARRADALALAAESFLAHEAIDAQGTDLHQIVVHVDAETLRDRSAGCCGFEHGPAMAAETARRFACDASIVALVEKDGEPLDVGRKTRTISAPLRRLLISRDKGCRFPGCANERWIDAHHIQHWANGGETKPSNLVSLCRFHHRAVHEGGIDVQVLDDGAFRFVRPNGKCVDSEMPGSALLAGDWQDLPVATKIASYRGDRMDLHLAVGALFRKAELAKNVPAGTLSG